MGLAKVPVTFSQRQSAIRLCRWRLKHSGFRFDRSHTGLATLRGKGTPGGRLVKGGGEGTEPGGERRGRRMKRSSSRRVGLNEVGAKRLVARLLGARIVLSSGLSLFAPDLRIPFGATPVAARFPRSEQFTRR